MSTPFDPLLPRIGQTMKEVIDSTRANLGALSEADQAHQADQAAHNLGPLRATQAEFNTHKPDPNAHNLGPLRAQVTATADEQAAARGTQATLADRLATALTPAGVIKLSTLASKFLDNGDVPSFVNNRVFTVPGDRTKVYQAGVILRASVVSGYVYGAVASSSFAAGATSVTLDPAYPVLAATLTKVEIALIAWDNSVAAAAAQNAADILTLTGLMSALKVQELTASVNGKPAAGAVVMRYVASRALSLPINLAASRIKAGVNATAAATFTLAKNGANVGTVVIAAGNSVGTAAVAAAVSLAPGDVLTLTAPGAQDATLADLAFNLQGSVT